jgi:acid phosphatase
VSGALHDDIVSGSLPNVGQVTPNLDNDAHDGSLLTADAWIKQWMMLILASPDWQSGRLAVIVTADEDDGSHGNTVLTIVIHPSQHGHVVDAQLGHYSWTRLMTDLTGAPCLGAGCTAADVTRAFDLPKGRAKPDGARANLWRSYIVGSWWQDGMDPLPPPRPFRFEHQGGRRRHS